MHTVINTNDFGILKRYVKPAKGYKFLCPQRRASREGIRPSGARLVHGVNRNVG
jgi:hypothetical protein